MSFTRVIPRDLFNEAKLLKCMGQLSLLLHEGCGIRWPLRLRHAHSRHGFVIRQDEDNGGLFVANLTMLLGKRRISLQSIYNSKDNFPLLCMEEDFGYERVLDESGQLTGAFAAWLDQQASKNSVTSKP